MKKNVPLEQSSSDENIKKDSKAKSRDERKNIDKDSYKNSKKEFNDDIYEEDYDEMDEEFDEMDEDFYEDEEDFDETIEEVHKDNETHNDTKDDKDNDDENLSEIDKLYGEGDPKELSIIDHLDELRSHIVIIILALIISGGCVYAFSPDIIAYFKTHYCEGIEKLYFMKPLDYFFTRIKVSLIMGALITSPIIINQMWKFISPALFRHEKRFISRFSILSTIFFLLGAWAALEGVYPMVMDFVLGMATEEIQPMLTIQSVINLAGMLMLGFGCMAQLPIVIFILISSGLVEASTISHFRPHTYVGILVLSAILTPPDVISQLAMGLPSFILFELGLLVAKIATRKKNKIKK